MGVNVPPLQRRILLDQDVSQGQLTFGAGNPHIRAGLEAGGEERLVERAVEKCTLMSVVQLRLGAKQLRVGKRTLVPLRAGLSHGGEV